MDMIKTKTALLTGAALDWAVARSIGQEVELTTEFASQKDGSQYAGFCCFAPGGRRPYKPSTDWGVGGHLIEKLSIQIEPPNSSTGQWVARTDCLLGHAHYRDSSSRTPLVAVCRAIVASLLGDEVEVPVVLASPDAGAQS